MRPIRIDITGTTDANGNFSQAIRLDKTGEWRNLKVAIGTTGPAEWALTTAGTPLTYGRGRRVTLGPELLQPFDTLTVSCTGGPVNAQVSGSCTGMGGTEQEIIASHTPSPNTISLDSLYTQRQIDDFTQAPGNVVVNRLYQLPAGTQNVRVQLNQNGLNISFSAFSVVGQATGAVYVFPSSGSGTGGFDEWFKPVPADVANGILFSLNTTGSPNGVEVLITADLAMNFVVASLIGAGTSNGAPLLVDNVDPAGWQAASLIQQFGIDMSVGGIHHVIIGTVGKTIYLHDIFAIPSAAVAAAGNWQDTAGNGVSTDTLQEAGARPMRFSGATLKGGAGAGLDFNVTAAVAAFLVGHVAYNLK